MCIFLTFFHFIHPRTPPPVILAPTSARSLVTYSTALLFYCSTILVCLFPRLPTNVPSPFFPNYISIIFVRAPTRKRSLITFPSFAICLAESSESSEQIAEGDHQSANPTMMPSGEWWGEKTASGNRSSTRNTIFTLQYNASRTAKRSGRWCSKSRPSGRVCGARGAAPLDPKWYNL